MRLREFWAVWLGLKQVENNKEQAPRQEWIFNGYTLCISKRIESLTFLIHNTDHAVSC